MRKLKRMAVGSLVALLALVAVPAAPAHAWERMQRTCAVNGYHPLLPNSCQSGFVEAAPNLNMVYVMITPYSGCQFDWWVRDGISWDIVGSGRTSGHAEAIWGLYSWYRVEVRNVGGYGCGGDATIRNTF